MKPGRGQIRSPTGCQTQTKSFWGPFLSERFFIFLVYLIIGLLELGAMPVMSTAASPYRNETIKTFQLWRKMVWHLEIGDLWGPAWPETALKTLLHVLSKRFLMIIFPQTHSWLSKAVWLGISTLQAFKMHLGVLSLNLDPWDQPRSLNPFRKWQRHFCLLNIVEEPISQPSSR